MRLFILFTLTATLVACVSYDHDLKNLSCYDHSELIKKKEVVFAESNYNKELLQDMLISYANFANYCSTDSLVPEYLMRRADLLRGAGEIRESINQFKAVHDGYPNYSNRITCAFITAFLYETELNDRDSAEKLYLQIIESYPDSYEADIARVSLRHLRETTDELIKRLKQQE